MRRGLRTLLTMSIVCLFQDVCGQLQTDSISALIKQEVNNRRAESIIVGVLTKNGRVFIQEGKLSDTNQAAPDSNTIYEIGSITKVFTSLLLAEMSLNKQLTLDDPITKYLPMDLTLPTRGGKEITLRSLATHRAGLPRFPDNASPDNLDNPYADYSGERLYEYISHFSTKYAIDSMWQYSNTGYGILGNILTKICHESFESLVREKIAEPLHLENTVISLSENQVAALAPGHTEYGALTNATDLGALAAAGALRSNAADLLSFAGANLGFLKSELYPAMLLTHAKQAKKDGNIGYVTLGWTLWNDAGDNIIFKDGGTYGYRTYIGIDLKNQFAVVVLSNSNNSVTDIGNHIIDKNSPIQPYKYPWKLLDTLLKIHRKTFSVAKLLVLYAKIKELKDPSFRFDEMQLDYLGNELRRRHLIKSAIQIFKVNISEYPGSVLPYQTLAELYYHMKDREKTKVLCQRILRLDPNNSRATWIMSELKK